MVSNADYQITIGTVAEGDGAAVVEQQISKLNKAAAGATISTKELKESIRLIAMNAGGALGPLGELAHMLGNPYILAAAGAALAIKMLIEKHKELVDQEIKNISASQDLAKLFRDGIAEGARIAAEKIENLVFAHDHLRDNADTATEALTRQLTVQKIITTGITEQISATESLIEAKIKLLEAEGKIRPDQASAENRDFKRAEEAQKEFEDEEGMKGESKAKRQRATDAAAEAAAAQDKLKAMQPDLSNIDASVITQEGRVKSLQQDAEDKRKAANAAKAEADNANILLPGYSRKKNDAAKAEIAAKAAEDLLAEQIKHLADLKQQEKEMNRQADSLGRLSDERDALARKLKEESDLLDQEIAARRKAFDERLGTERQADAFENQADQINHLKELQKKIESGKATPEENREWNVHQQADQEPAGQIGSDTRHIEQAIALHRGRAFQPDEKDALLDQAATLLEALAKHPGIKDAADIRSRLDRVEQLLGQSGNTRF